ncbi:MAG: hypothetical protein AB7R67_20215 [Vicinamibacterales bacterium]
MPEIDTTTPGVVLTPMDLEDRVAFAAYLWAPPWFRARVRGAVHAFVANFGRRLRMPAVVNGESGVQGIKNDDAEWGIVIDFPTAFSIASRYRRLSPEGRQLVEQALHCAAASEPGPTPGRPDV